jgi:hypothetical protein
MEAVMVVAWAQTWSRRRLEAQVQSSAPDDSDSVHSAQARLRAAEQLSLPALWEAMFELKGQVTRALEKARAAGALGSAAEAEVTLLLPPALQSSSEGTGSGASSSSSSPSLLLPVLQALQALPRQGWAGEGQGGPALLPSCAQLEELLGVSYAATASLSAEQASQAAEAAEPAAAAQLPFTVASSSAAHAGLLIRVALASSRGSAKCARCWRFRALPLQQQEDTVAAETGGSQCLCQRCTEAVLLSGCGSA